MPTPFFFSGTELLASKIGPTDQRLLLDRHSGRSPGHGCGTGLHLLEPGAPRAGCLACNLPLVAFSPVRRPADVAACDGVRGLPVGKWPRQPGGKVQAGESLAMVRGG